MNPDREMQMEAMDMAQDEILRLQEALAVEKGAHVETAKALVACRKALQARLDACCEPDGSPDEKFAYCESCKRDMLALSSVAGDDYVSKASVKPIVEAVIEVAAHFETDCDHNYMCWLGEGTALRVSAALDQAKLLGLV